MGFAWVSGTYSVLPRAANLPEFSEVLVYLQMLGRLPRLLNYSLAFFTFSLRGRRSKGEGIGNLGARQRLREKPLALLVRPKSPFPSLPFPSNACHAGYVTLKDDFH